MPSIIGTKGLDNQHPFCAIELHELFVGGDNMAKQGMPPEIPAAIPLGQLLRLTATLKKYHDICALTVERYEKWATSTEDDGLGEVETVIASMKELLNIGPPIAKPQQSRLIIPTS